MGGYRTDCYGRGQALHGDKTTTGATCYGSVPNCIESGLMILRVGDKTSPCPRCGQPGKIISGENRLTWHGIASAVDGSEVLCGCPPGTNKVIAPLGQGMGSGSPRVHVAQEKQGTILAARQTEEQQTADRVFAKSCLRGEGCNDAGDQREPHTNFAEMAFFRAAPAADPATNAETAQRAQSTKKKTPTSAGTPEPKKRSALYKWWSGDNEDMDYQAATAAAAGVARAQTAHGRSKRS
ncbi:PAAR domain-containing protein [Dryocola sp. BD586]|uniref:PAAR domain-containing protein n=1 Tax=Dryocola sp. BD586 TaxID=3133271 RepID=UPI003F50A161